MIQAKRMDGRTMGFPVGRLERIAQKHGTFDDYEIWGDWVAGSGPQRGWYVLINGLDSGSFAVVNGEIHRSGRVLFGGPNGETSTPIGARADIRASAKQAIFTAIKQWEAEEREKPGT